VTDEFGGSGKNRGFQQKLGKTEIKPIVMDKIDTNIFFRTKFKVLKSYGIKKLFTLRKL